MSDIDLEYTPIIHPISRPTRDMPNPRLTTPKLAEAALAAALYDDGCIRPPQTDHVEHVLVALDASDPGWCGHGAEIARLREKARQVHVRHDLGHQLGAWPNACALCETFALAAPEEP